MKAEHISTPKIAIIRFKVVPCVQRKLWQVNSPTLAYAGVTRRAKCKVLSVIPYFLLFIKINN